MAGARDIQRRIKSITNTRKVTGAMEVVSAAKMKKAVTQVLALRPYAHAMHALLDNIAPQAAASHPLLAVRDVNNVLVLVIASNKGLCGSFNANVARMTRSLLEKQEVLAQTRNRRGGKKKIAADLTVDFVTIGKKADHLVKMLGKKSIASFPDLNFDSRSEAMRPITKMIFDAFEEEKYDKIAVIYTDYVNAITQEQKVRQLLPVSRVDLEKQLAEMDYMADEYGIETREYAYVAEPSNEEALREIVPRVLETQILHAILESNASKESARMIAMKNATDAAGDIIDDLTLTYNKLRQAKITQEISEISAGRAALE